MCGGVAVTRDHLPPQCLFPDDDRHQLITLPCCDSCNQSFKGLDEHFRAFVASVENATPAAKRVLLEKVFSPKAVRSPGSTKLRSSFREIERIVDGNIQNVGTISMEQKDADRFLKRLAKGLTYRLYPQAWSVRQFARVWPMNAPHPIVDKAIAQAKELLPMLKHDSRGTGVFDFYHGVTRDTQCSTVWIFGFYGAAWFLVLLSNRTHPGWG